MRAIARDLSDPARGVNISASTVWRILQENPARLETARARLRDERTANYRRIERLGQKTTIAWLKKAHKAGQEDLGKLTDRKVKALHAVPRLITAAVMAADRSTRATQLLTGQPTEIPAPPEAGTNEIATADEAIEMAIAENRLDLLSPYLRRQAEARMNARGAAADKPSEDDGEGDEDDIDA